jgi:hypothetical protein
MSASIEQAHTFLLEHAPVLAPLIVILLGVFVVSRIASGDASRLPLLGKEYGNLVQRRKAYIANAASFYNKGYQTFKDQAYRLTTVDGMASQGYLM